MWKGLLLLLGAIIGTPGIALAIAHIWVKFNGFDSKGGRYQRGRNVHPLLTLIGQLDLFCEHFFKFRLVSIEKKKLLRKAAKAQHDSELFGEDGDKHFMELFESALDGAQNNPEISFTGRVLLNQNLQSLITSREKVIAWAIQNRDLVLKTEIRSPIIITGIGRAGSTLLQNLLSQDPVARGCKHWEIIWFGNPCPPATKEQVTSSPPSHRKYHQVVKAYKTLEKYCPEFVKEFAKTHPIEPEQYDEELVILTQAMILHIFFPILGDKFFEKFHDTKNKEFAYLYLKRYLQMMASSYPPESHWVLKAPVHMVFLPILLKVFPDARVVMCHRRMDILVPSGISFFESFNASFLKDGYDRYDFGQRIKNHGIQMKNQMMSFRSQYSNPDQFFDLHYNDIVGDPIAAVKRIYSHFNLKYTQEFEDNMKKWIENNRQGKHGRHQYSMEMYNLKQEDIDEFSDYTSAFIEKEFNVENKKIR